MSQRTSPPCSPGQWVHSTCDVSKCQVFPGVLRPRVHRTLLAEDSHKEQGSAGTGLTVQAAWREGAAPPLLTRWWQSWGVHGELAARLLGLMPRTRSEGKNWCQTGSYNPGIQTFLGDFQTRAGKPLCMYEQLNLTPTPVRSQGPFYRLVSLGAERSPIQGSWATECLDGELGFWLWKTVLGETGERMPEEECWFWKLTSVPPWVPLVGPWAT